MPRRISFPIAALFVAFWASFAMFSKTATAQEGISLDTFRPASGIDSLYELVLPTPKKHMQWYFSGLLSHAQEPVFREVIRIGGPTRIAYPVWFRRQLDLSAAVGLLGFMEVGLSLPIIIYQISDDPIDHDDVQRAGVGDPRVDFKAKLLEWQHSTLGAGASLTLPIGHYASSGRDYLGSKLPTFEPKVLVESHFGALLLAANGGFLIRKKAEAGDTEQSSAITWNLGVGYDVDDFNEPHGFRLALETHGEVGINFDDTTIPIETLFGFKYRTPTDIILTFGGGPGISRGLGTPTYRAMFGVGYDPLIRNCPAGPEDMDGFQDDDRCIDPDNDQDGILDVDDDCINEPEDIDKFQDNDGCPDTDNDGDQILDNVDKCPFIPEDVDDYEDEDGCPEEGPGKPTVKVTDTQLLVSSKVYFDFDKATIKEVSYPILDAVAETVMGNPHIAKLQIEGHTDNEGTEDYNQALSEQRALAVKTYLVGKGVPEDRLGYKGFGFTRPKASNETEEGKAINRRVEFTIIHGETQ
jgi:outer membrane protein OmpA-like peptidoglycan-associated protein